MKVLVIAQDVQIRDALVTQFGIRHRQFHCVDRAWLKEQGESLSIPADIGIVVNAVNVNERVDMSSDNTLFERIRHLSQACECAESILIHLSSSRVFDGVSGDSRQKESDAASPVSGIGQSLLQIEQAVIETCSRHIILRSGPLFSPIGCNVLTSLIELFKDQEPLIFSNNGSNAPVYNYDLARVISAIIDQLSCDGRGWGIYHYHSSDPVSHFKFAEAALSAVSQCDQRLGVGVDLQPENTLNPDWSQPLLNCEKVLNTFGIKQLPWRMFLASAVKNILTSVE